MEIERITSSKGEEYIVKFNKNDDVGQIFTGINAYFPYEKRKIFMDNFDTINTINSSIISSGSLLYNNNNECETIAAKTCELCGECYPDDYRNKVCPSCRRTWKKVKQFFFAKNTDDFENGINW